MVLSRHFPQLSPEAAHVRILPNQKWLYLEDRDIEKGCSVKQTAAKLRRLADCLENGKQFQIQIAGERIQIPAKAIFNIEHEREGNIEEVESQFKWER